MKSLFCGSVCLTLFLVVSPCSAGLLAAGDIVVVDRDAVIRVDPVTGAQQVLSSGGLFADLIGVAVTPNSVLVVDRTAGVVRVNPDTGSQSLLSSGGLFVDPVGIALAASGEILVADAGGSGAVLRVDPTTGSQTVLSSGGFFVDPFDLVLDSIGNILVADQSALDGSGRPYGAVFRVDPLTGAQTTISSGGLFRDPVGLAVEASGSILVADALTDTILRVDPLTGDQTALSFGGAFAAPFGVAVENSGQILVVDSDAFASAGVSGAVFRVDPTTGNQTALSSGGAFFQPRGIAVVMSPVPEPSTGVLLALGALSLLVSPRRRGRTL